MLGLKYENQFGKNKCMKIIKTICIATFFALICCCNNAIVKKENNIEKVRSQTGIKAIIDQETIKLKPIYENALKRNPEISGKLEVKFIIQPNGNLKDVSALSCSSCDTQFVNELITKVSKWKFPILDDTTNCEIKFPIYFDVKNNN
jgi:hypothetical protein